MGVLQQAPANYAAAKQPRAADDPQVPPACVTCNSNSAAHHRIVSLVWDVKPESSQHALHDYRKVILSSDVAPSAHSGQLSLPTHTTFIDLVMIGVV